MKNLFKYVFMLMVVVMGAVVISSCSKDDDDSGSGTAEAGKMVIDGTSYKINAIEYATERKITFLDSTTGTNVEIESETIGKSIPDPFPSSLSDVFCKLELRPGGHEVAEGAAIIKCAKNGNTYQCVISNLNVNGHTLSLSFNDDITKYPNE